MTYSRMKGCSDEELMALVKDRDHDALAILFDRYHRLVLSVALKVLRDHGEAEDLMQDIFFEVYRKADQFDPNRGLVKAWLLQAAYYRSFNRRAFLKLRRFYDGEALTCGLVANRVALDGIWNGLTIEEWHRAIEEGLKTLTEKQQVTMRLSYARDLNLREVAAETHETFANVRHYYYRGLKRLRTFLQSSSDVRALTSFRQG